MLPNVLKMMNVHGDGDSWLGVVNEFTPPKIGRQLEEWRGGGLDAPVKLDLGGAALECEVKLAGRLKTLILKTAQPKIDGVALRFNGGFQSDETGNYAAAEIYVRGRVEELDRGAYKVGEVGEETMKLSLVYYREIEDGRTLLEIDVLNRKFIVNGVDRLAEARAIVGG